MGQARTLAWLGLLALAGCGGQAAEGAGAASAASAEAASALPAGSHEVQGRAVVFRLPYRSAEGRLWVAGTGMAESEPFVFQSLDIEPGAGPGGTDLAVFAYKADRAGSATLEFGLVPASRTLIGPPETRIDRAGIPFYSTTITVQ
jgi:hypothetical protein